MFNGVDRVEDDDRNEREHQCPDQRAALLAQLEEVSTAHAKCYRGHARTSSGASSRRVVISRKRCSRLWRTGSRRATPMPARTRPAFTAAAVSGAPASTT